MTVRFNETVPSTLPKLVLTVEQLATEFDIGKNSAYELVCSEDFPSFRIGRKILVDYDGLKCWIKNQCQNGSARISEKESNEQINKGGNQNGDNKTKIQYNQGTGEGK